MSKPPSIAVVGAGIGGLAVAALLKRQGYDVQVYEQARRFERVGAGIQTTPNAVKVLRRLGVEERLKGVAYRSELRLSREWDSGRITSELKLGEEVERKFGAPFLCLHRADLHAAIESTVPPEIVHFGMKLADLLWCHPTRGSLFSSGLCNYLRAVLGGFVRWWRVLV